MATHSIVDRTMFETTTAGAGPRDTIELRRGETVSRYLLLERVGAGGMGEVWAAYDPELDRRVAIKLLRPRGSAGEASQEARARLVREAQAMARLSHPNVIAVHDVGEHAGQVFVAMELIASGTLTRWLKQQPRTWRAIVAAFVQAGRGLAAAHAAGLVHRDFKPDNVLIDEQGRARVTDFGLARSVELGEVDEPSAARLRTIEETGREHDSGATPALHTPLTRTGALLGTPAYMAPEQFSSSRFDARSDQFALCVALWEALYGQRPFHGRTLVELSEAVGAGRIDPPPTDARAPGFLERALRRGLAVDPEQRWPDVDALLRELERDPALGRRRWLVAGGLAACMAAALLAGALIDAPEAPAADPCPTARARLSGIWDADRRAQLDARLAAHERWIPAELDRYADAWLAMHQDACADTHVRNEQSTELLDRRMQCLDDRLLSLDATVKLLVDGDAASSPDTPTLLGKLPAISRCDDREFLASQIPIPDDPALAEQVAAVRAKVAEARALVDGGRPMAAEPALREALAAAERLGYAPLRAQAQVELGFAIAGYAEAEQARAALEAGMTAAVATGQDLLAARAGAELIYVVGRRLERPEEGLRLARIVHAWNARTHASPVERALTLLSEGTVMVAQGQAEPGHALLYEGLALLGVDERLAGLDRLDASEVMVATYILNVLGVDAHYHGDFREARRIITATAAMRERFAAAGDPLLVLLRNNIASAEFTLGEWPAARRSLLAQAELIAGRSDIEPVMPAVIRLNLLDNELAEAELLGDEALAGFVARADEVAADQRLFTDQHRGFVIESAVILARFDRLRGQLDAAEAKLAAIPPFEDDRRLRPLLTQVALERGALRLAQRRLADALAEFEAAEQIATNIGVREQPNVAQALLGQGQALAALARPDDARARIADALALWAALAPAGHPHTALALDALAELEPARAAEHREAAAKLRARLRHDYAAG